MNQPIINKTVLVKAVRFSSSSGEPRCVTLEACIFEYPSMGKCLKLIKGVTGYESFCLEGAPGRKRAIRDFSHMVVRGWWACGGTPGRWDALYIHGLQMKKVFKELNVTWS